MKKNASKIHEINRKVAKVLKQDGYEVIQNGLSLSVYSEGAWVGALLPNGDIQGSDTAAADIAIAYQNATR